MKWVCSCLTGNEEQRFFISRENVVFRYVKDYNQPYQLVNLETLESLMILGLISCTAYSATKKAREKRSNRFRLAKRLFLEREIFLYHRNGDLKNLTSMPFTGNIWK